MAIVDEMYSEKDTLQTEIEVNTIAIEHASGENWGISSDWSGEVLTWDGPTGTISDSSPHDANLYVFVTGSESQEGLGLGWKGSLCDSSRRRRNCINKYSAGSQKGGDAYTAEVITHSLLSNYKNHGGSNFYDYKRYDCVCVLNVSFN